MYVRFLGVYIYIHTNILLFSFPVQPELSFKFYIQLQKPGSVDMTLTFCPGSSHLGAIKQVSLLKTHRGDAAAGLQGGAGASGLEPLPGRGRPGRVPWSQAAGAPACPSETACGREGGACCHFLFPFPYGRDPNWTLMEKSLPP